MASKKKDKHEALPHNLSLLLNSMDEGVYEINLEGRGTYINKAAAALLGYEPDDLLNIKDNWHSVIHHSYPDGSPYPIEECLIYTAFLQKKGCHVENEVFWRRDGTCFPVEYSSYPIFEKNQVKGAVITFRDITWRLKIENELRQERDKYRQLLHEMQETQELLIQSEKMAMLGTLVAGIAHEVNTPLGVINASISNVNYLIDQILEQFPLLIKQVPVDQLEEFINSIRNIFKDTNLTTIIESRKIKKELIARLNQENISSADKIADDLIDAGLNKNLDLFLPVLKEEKGPLLLEFSYHLSMLFRSFMHISESVKRASKIIFALKSYSHQQYIGNKTKEDIRNNIDIILMLYHFQTKKGIKIIKNYQDVPPILAFHDELNQVWTNLIHNAIYSLETHGTLTIDVFQQEKNIIIKFIDNGRGISEQVMAHLFEPFFTTKPKGEGTGLGLSIVKKIIEKYNGTISVESNSEQTAFTVVLPINEEEKESD